MHRSSTRETGCRFVGGDHQRIEGQTDGLGTIAGEHVAKVAGRHREQDPALGAAEGNGGDKIVGDLCDDAPPIDRIDGGKPHAVTEGEIVEHRLDQTLAVVERALDGNGVHVVLGRGCHHAPLHVRDAPVGKEHDHIDPPRPAKGLDRRPTRIARGRRDDRRAIARGGEPAIEQAGEQLHGDVLERQRRPVKQLEHP